MSEQSPHIGHRIASAQIIPVDKSHLPVGDKQLIAEQVAVDRDASADGSFRQSAGEFSDRFVDGLRQKGNREPNDVFARIRVMQVPCLARIEW